MPPRRFTDEQELNIIQMYTSGLSTNEIGKNLNCPNPTILTILKRNHIDRRNTSDCQRKYTLNEDIFDFIDNEQKAYWLGFLFADGSVSSKKNSVVLTLAAKDKEHVVKFANFIGNNSPIKESRNRANGKIFEASNFFTRSFKLNATLRNLGVNTGRTNPTKPFDSVPDHLKHHFIRGVFDGDGTCTVYGKNDAYIRYTFLGPQDALWQICNFISCKGIRCPSMPASRKDANISVMHYHNRDACFDIMNLMYQDSTVYLPRKFKVAQDYYARLLSYQET